MSRGLTATVQTEVEKDRLQPVWLMEFNFSTVLRFWTGIGDLSWNGETWSGSGDVIKFSGIDETSAVQANGIQFQLAGMDSALVSLALTEDVQGRRVNVYMGFIPDPCWDGESWTNLLNESADFEAADWTSGGLTKTAAASIGYGGLMTATKLEDDDALAAEQTYQQITVPDDATSYTFSVYVREGNTAQTSIHITLTGGSSLSVAGVITWATKTMAGGTLEHVENGLYRAYVTLANDASGNTILRAYLRPAATTVDQVGYAYFDAAQVVADTVPGDYVATTTESAVGMCRNGLRTAYYEPFTTGDGGALAINSTVTHDTTTKTLTWTPTGADPQVTLEGLSIDGATYNRVRMKVRLVSGTDAGIWEGALRYRDAATGYTLGVLAVADPAFVLGEWVVMEWDLSSDATWLSSTITGLRFDLVNNSTGAPVFEVAYVDAIRRDSMQPAPDPVGPFQYIMDTFLIDDTPGQGAITLSAESYLASLERARLRRYTHEDQQIEFPGDMGLEYVAAIQNAEIKWGQ